MRFMEANSSHPKKRNSLSDMTKKDKKKLRAQVKSRFYYVFWGIATLAVVTGQLYVGTGYRIMTEGVNRLTWALSRAIK